MLLDANLLLYAVDELSPFHASARDWLSQQLSGRRRVGFPWQTLGAFLRVTTHPRALDQPLSPEAAWRYIDDWLVCDVVWVPQPGPGYAAILGDLVVRHHVHGNLVSDAQLAALAIEHGVSVASADTRFTEVRWENPVSSGR